MPEERFFLQVIVILAAAVVFAPLFQRLRLGPVLGYLVAGVLIGPSVLAAVPDLEAARLLAELGVVFLLFTVGLGLPLERVRVMPKSAFWLAFGQIGVTAGAIGLIAFAAGTGLSAAIVIGGGLALSSTAIALRLMADRGELTGRMGRHAFSILVIQDLAVGLMLVAVAALGANDGSVLVEIALAFAKLAAAIVLLLGVGRYLLRPVFWAVARSRNTEAFTALTLLIVIATGLLTALAGLSMEFGALLAGMLIAETNYRHQVEAEIEPFRGLFMGLFFMTVGMSFDLALAIDQAGLVLGLSLGLFVAKSAVLFVLSLLAGLSQGNSLRLAITLGQGGEFAFVLFGVAVGVGILTPEISQPLMVAVVITMMATPGLTALGARIGRMIDGRAIDRPRRRVSRGDDEQPAEPQLEGHVVIAGYGRVGTAVGDQLARDGIRFVAVDLDPARISRAREKGANAIFGDATKPDVLEAIHVEQARAVVVSLDNPKATLTVVALLHYIFPDLPVYARAYDSAHAEELRAAGADVVVPELVATGLKLAGILRDTQAKTSPADTVD